MINIKIVSAPPGPTTTENLLTLIRANPQGISISELKNALNRPASMLQRCLKPLILQGQVSAQLNESGMQLIYYPNRE